MMRKLFITLQFEDSDLGVIKTVESEHLLSSYAAHEDEENIRIYVESAIRKLMVSGPGA